MTSVLQLTVPVALDVPQQMAIPAQEVLAGEYESGLFGEGLTILDIGANVGAFSIWASARWPGSTITAYEPHPGTFEMLERNVASFANISVANAAVYPSDKKRISFFARYPGDGEAGIAGCSEQTFDRTPEKQRFEVAVTHPRKIPPSDVVKIDTEGSEAEILAHLDLSQTSLVLLEYQNDSNRAQIKGLLEPRFDLLLEEEFRWDPLLRYGYKPELAGDHYGHLFFAAKQGCKLHYPERDRRPRASWRSIAAEAYHKLRGD